MACIFPYYVRNQFPTAQDKTWIPVPCGRCPSCLQRRASSWAFRIAMEAVISDSASFITLTYDNDHVPITDRKFMNLSKRDVQLFIKRLRFLHPKGHKRIRYYCAAEYGSSTHRPHYHLIMFDVDVELLEAAWQLGQVHVGNVEHASISYTVKYISKGRTVPAHKNDDRQPEFSLMSKKMGLKYLTPEMVDYHHQDLTRNYITLEGGIKIAMPRYYRDRIFSAEQKDKQAKSIAAMCELQEQARKDAYKLRIGSMDGYQLSVHEAKKASISNYKNQSKSNRNKI